MKLRVLEATFEVEVGAGEALAIPEDIARLFGAGTWVLDIRPKDEDADEIVRDHSAFLNGYGPEDEGLYDDL